MLCESILSIVRCWGFGGCWVLVLNKDGGPNLKCNLYKTIKNHVKCSVLQTVSHFKNR